MTGNMLRNSSVGKEHSEQDKKKFWIAIIHPVSQRSHGRKTLCFLPNNAVI